MNAGNIVDAFVSDSKWNLVPAKRLFTSSKEINQGMKESNRLALTMKGVINRSLDDLQGLQSSDYSVYQIFEKDDLVFKLIDLENIKTSRVGIVHERGIMSPAYIRVSACSNSIYPRFYYWYFFALYLTNIYNKLGGGVRQNLTAGDLLEIPVPLIDISLQKQVSAFLDRETQRIDSLIEEKQAFIKLLKEKRQALISHVVTKGLNPDVEMQDSGIEWIGQVPKHWEKCRVKQVSSFITSGPRGWSDFISDNGNAIFLQSGDLNNELGLNLAKAKKVSPPDGAEGQRTQLQLDDVVVCITGANTGRVALVKELDSTVYINQHLSLIRPIGEKVRPKYLAYFLSSEAGSRYYALEQYGLKEGLSLKNIAETPLMLPPVSEQTSIEKYLDKALAILSSLVTSVEESINLLKEHRTSLISAAVTGKIDVREAV
ncbi:restriction endonuclease subunit S [Vibrio cholerae]|uniref:restriction endonuclease subunit S n=1 Tax=Vibrio cholerae TaxID=666 RepID=UPI0011D5EA06|nr:restriction endonuclease subunit S [Vibrio cholerae]EGR5587794.1 restriction endonuclease subunit S [Vibrio cholerae]EKF9295205.1 restriction endonuclease subunit S [Vibrio cholerae]ELM6610655.1 restriction endonuclease subunit S [Vibrio cholerae]MDV2357909.1 restriction endonuclease subunit S [Vibrio cholerae]TXX93031.1 restriction endonuclease subunit S [Vibrio cholerae]